MQGRIENENHVTEIYCISMGCPGAKKPEGSMYDK
jgi:hypothetical protein